MGHRRNAGTARGSATPVTGLVGAGVRDVYAQRSNEVAERKAGGYEGAVLADVPAPLLLAGIVLYHPLPAIVGTRQG